MAGVCVFCGTPYEDGAKFCTECGAALISRMGENETVGVKNTESTKETEGIDTTTDAMEADTLGSQNPGAEEASSASGNDENDGVSNGGNPYIGGNYGTPNGGNPYSGGNYGAPNGGNPYSGGNYGAPNGGNPYGGGNYGAPNGGNQYGGGNYGAPNGGNYPPYYNPYGMPQQPVKPVNLGMLIFSIINILMGCCACVGFIFGGAGLVFTLMAKNTKTDGDESVYNRIALILNVVGVIMTVLVLVAAYSLGYLNVSATV